MLRNLRYNIYHIDRNGFSVLFSEVLQQFLKVLMSLEKYFPVLKRSVVSSSKESKVSSTVARTLLSFKLFDRFLLDPKHSYCINCTNFVSSEAYILANPPSVKLFVALGIKQNFGFVPNLKVDSTLQYPVHSKLFNPLLESRPHLTCLAPSLGHITSSDITPISLVMHLCLKSILLFLIVLTNLLMHTPLLLVPCK